MVDPSLATQDDIRACFRLLLGREPGVSEWPGHSSRAGAPLEAVVREFLTSLEFQRRNLFMLDSELERIDLDGRPMFVYADDMGICASLRTGVFEPEVTRLIRAKLRRGDTFLDIGANVGYYSLLGAEIVGHEGKVLAVEASVRNVRALRASMRVADIRNIEILSVAASSSWELLAFGLSGTNGITGSLVTNDVQEEVVQGVPLDDAIRGLQRLDLIKIDVEGAEHLALQGLTKALKMHRPAIVSEFSPEALEAVSGTSGEAYLEMLLGLGYRMSVVSSEGASVRATRSADEILERFRASGVDHIDVLFEPES